MPIYRPSNATNPFLPEGENPEFFYSAMPDPARSHDRTKPLQQYGFFPFRNFSCGRGSPSWQKQCCGSRYDRVHEGRVRAVSGNKLYPRSPSSGFVSIWQVGPETTSSILPIYRHPNATNPFLPEVENPELVDSAMVLVFKDRRLTAN